MGLLPAAAVVSPLLAVVCSRLTDALHDEYELRKDAQKSIKRLKKSLQLSLPVIENVERNPNPPEAVRRWAAGVRDVLNSAQDVLDHHATSSALRSMANSRRKAKWKLLYPLFSPLLRLLQHPFLSARGVARVIKEIEEELDFFAKVKSANSIQPPGEVRDARRSSLPTSLPDVSAPVVGRDAELRYLLQWLGRDNDLADGGGGLSLLFLVGIGGIGKTALARVVSNNQEEREFPVRMWACVTEDFTVERITREMLESAVTSISDGRSASVPDFRSTEAIQKALAKVIEGKRFLLVLDDVWYDGQAKLTDLLKPLWSDSHVDKSNKVIVTCRSTDVASSIVGVTADTIVLKGLPKESLIQIFDRFAFGQDRSVPNRAQLEKIRDGLVDNRFKGSPLAARTMARLLYSDLDLEFWRTIANSEIWQLEDQQEMDLFPVLYLSYLHLTPDLKQCFAYCSLFPKGHGFNKDRLIWLWMAQCFIQEKNGLSLEMIGRQCFNRLSHRLFLEFDSNSGLYHMHDLIHDLAKLVSKEECISSSHRNHSLLKDPALTIRHASFTGWDSSVGGLDVLRKFKNLHSVLLDHNLPAGSISYDILDLWCKKLKNLHVLSLDGCDVRRLPNSIGKLKLLRHLNLSNNPVEFLPEEVCNLYNLQVLDLDNCYSFKKLPTGMSKLVKLRHIIVDKSCLDTLDRIGELTSLQELEVFRVFKRKGHQISELKDLTMLHGALAVENLENVENREEASQAGLEQKTHLEELKLEWSGNVQIDDQLDVFNDVLEGLKPNGNLERLIFRCHPGNKFPTWMEDDRTLRHLKMVGIRNCQKWDALPPLCRWQSLEILEISGVGLTHITGLFRGDEGTVLFPALKELVLKDMDKWDGWDETCQSFLPCLEKLCIENCPLLVRIPSLPQTTQDLFIRNVGLELLPNLRCRDAEVLHEITYIPSSSGSSSFLSSLHIEACPNLISLDAGLFRSQLRNLEKLRVINCGNLDQLPAEGFAKLVSLNTLEIRKCPKLVFLPMEQGFLPSSLSNMKIWSCASMASLGRNIVSNLTALKVLEICDCESLEVLELDSFSSLDTLTINACPGLISLPEEMLLHLHSLKQLLILNCDGLTTLGFGAIESLELLSVTNCPNLTFHPSSSFSVSLKYLTVRGSSLQLLESFILQVSRSQLVRLIIFDCCDLKNFDNELEEALLGLVSLRELFISRCPQLVSLPTDLSKLTSLSILQIKNCDLIDSLPHDHLPASLDHLWISDCPRLEERYSKKGGRDWNKISRISDVTVS